MTDGWKAPGVTGRLEISGLVKGLWFSDFKSGFFFLDESEIFLSKQLRQGSVLKDKV